MIEKLAASNHRAFGFKVTGELTTADIADLSHQIDDLLTQQKHPIGLLADLSAMHGATWAARWAEMRFLHAHTDHIARFAVVNDDQWEDLGESVLTTLGGFQAQTLYFHPTELAHAWHWVKFNKPDDSMPTRVIYPGSGLFSNYTPDFMGI